MYYRVYDYLLSAVSTNIVNIQLYFTAIYMARVDISGFYIHM